MKRKHKTSLQNANYKDLFNKYPWQAWRSTYLYPWRWSARSIVSVKSIERYQNVWESPESPESPWLEVEEEGASP